MVINSLLNAANVIVSVVGTAGADTVTGGAGTAISGLTSLLDLARRMGQKAPALSNSIAHDLATEFATQHLSDAQKTLIPQMIEQAPLSAPEVMAAARNPARLAQAMLAKLHDPAHCTPAARDAFTRVLTPILTRLLADKAVSDTLRPAFENAVAESLRFIGEQVEQLTTQMKDAIERASVAEFVIKELARRFVPGAGGDFETARRDLEKALEVYAAQQAQGRLPRNHNDAVDTVYEEVTRLNALARFDEGSDAIDAAIKAEQEASNARQSALLDLAVQQSRLRNAHADAARHLIARLHLDAPADQFNALRALQDEWYERGSDAGIAFDAAVAIDLARHSVQIAQTPDQRGTALNDLGNALLTLGEREGATDRLTEAVAAYAQALKEYTRDRLPLKWAGTQNNLGNALLRLGQRTGSPDHLTEAVTAFTEALKELPRDRVPLDWAMTQNNLGNALLTLGEREGSPDRLTEAITAYTEALKEYTRDRVPLDWAATQNNLGNALLTLGQWEGSTHRLTEAVTAYAQALKERTRDRVPLDWATTQMNLGNALLTLGQWEGSTHRLTEAVTAYAQALKERTRNRVPLDWAATQNNLGNALKTLGEREGSPDRLTEAVTAYAQALKEYTRDRVPLDWANTIGNQGSALRALAALTRDAAMAKTALDQLELAESVLRDGGHIPWADTFAHQIPKARDLLAALTS